MKAFVYLTSELFTGVQHPPCEIIRSGFGLRNKNFPLTLNRDGVRVGAPHINGDLVHLHCSPIVNYFGVQNWSTLSAIFSTMLRTSFPPALSTRVAYRMKTTFWFSSKRNGPWGELNLTFRRASRNLGVSSALPPTA